MNHSRSRALSVRGAMIIALLAAASMMFASTALRAETLPQGSAPAARIEFSDSLDSLIVIAMRDSPRLRALEADHEAMLAQASRAGALPDPTLTYSYQGAPIDEPWPTAAMEQRIELEQMLPFPGKQGLMKSMMSAEAEMAKAQLDRARLEVVAELHAAYRDLQLLHASIAIAEENQATLRTIAVTARTRYETGASGQTDLLKTNVEAALGQARLASLRVRVPAALSRVNALLDRPADTPVALGTTRVPELPELPALESRALAAQPMLRMQQRAIEKAELAVRLAKREALPDFMVGGGYMAMKDADDAWMGMLGVTLPIWRGNKLGPMRRQAEQELAAARAQLEQARNETVTMVREEWAMAAGARETLRAYEESVVPQAEQAFIATRAGYETGSSGFLDLLDAQRSRLQARLGLIEARTEYLKHLAQLALAAGDGARLGLESGVSHD
jgi:cobalt-zinc-cadmium efflux system outer membrane protein